METQLMETDLSTEEIHSYHSNSTSLDIIIPESEPEDEQPEEEDSIEPPPPSQSTSRFFKPTRRARPWESSPPGPSPLPSQDIKGKGKAKEVESIEMDSKFSMPRLESNSSRPTTASSISSITSTSTCSIGEKRKELETVEKIKKKRKSNKEFTTAAKLLKSKPEEGLEMESGDEIVTAASKLDLSKYKLKTISPNVMTSEVSEFVKPKPKAPRKKSEKKLKVEATETKSKVEMILHPLLLPPNPYITALAACPICKVTFDDQKTKTVQTKSTHLRKCAAIELYTTESLLEIVEDQIMKLGKVKDDRKRLEVSQRSLFEMAIGKGEGISIHKEVTVVGVELLGEPVKKGVAGTAEELMRSDVQTEINKERVKVKAGVDSTIKLANKIKLERKLKLESSQLKKLQSENSTGKLLGNTTQLERDTIEKAKNVIESLGGSGLTQLNPTLLDQNFQPSFQLHTQSNLDDDFIDTVDYQEEDVLPPPPTQPFKPSKLKSVLLAKSLERGVTQIDLTLSDDEEEFDNGKVKSLWKAAEGIDDKTLRRIVDISYQEGQFKLNQPLGIMENQKQNQMNLETEMELMNMNGSVDLEDGVLVWEGNSSSPTVDRWEGVELEQEEAEVEVELEKKKKSVVVEEEQQVLPNYQELDLSELQKRVEGFGFKITKNKKSMIGILERVWKSQHPTLEVIIEPKKKSKKKKDLEEEQLEVVETVGEKLRLLILSNIGLYTRILLYEPIFFDEILKLTSEAGIKASKELLMKCLDEQSITFYTQDPTNCTRKRH